MTALMRRRPVLSFVVLAYAGSWILWSPWWLARFLSHELPIPAVAGINQLGLFGGPFAAALIVTGVSGGRAEIGRLLRRLGQWRVRPRWYLLAVVAIPAVIIAAHLLLTRTAATLSVSTAVALLITGIVYLLGGPVQEEPGWRGFALPRMQQRWHPLVAAVILGVIHCCWHAPLFLTSEWDTARQDPGQYVGYLLLVVSLSVVMSWLVNRSRGSLLLAVLAHNALNWAMLVAGTVTGQATVSNWPAAIAMTVLAVVAIGLTRGRLGHQTAWASRPDTTVAATSV